jgi:hypothetical protein
LLKDGAFLQIACKKEGKLFNALKYTKILEEAGFEREKAEILVSMFMQMLEFNMVSKSDFERFRTGEFESFRAEVRHSFEKMDEKIDKLALQLTVKLGVMLALSVGLLSTILAIKL